MPRTQACHRCLLPGQGWCEPWSPAPGTRPLLWPAFLAGPLGKALPSSPPQVSHLLPAEGLHAGSHQAGSYLARSRTPQCVWWHCAWMGGRRGGLLDASQGARAGGRAPRKEAAHPPAPLGAARGPCRPERAVRPGPRAGTRSAAAAATRAAAAEPGRAAGMRNRRAG